MDEMFYEEDEAMCMEFLDQLDEDAYQERRRKLMLHLQTGIIPRSLEPYEVATRRWTWRDRHFYHENMMHDYFYHNCVYSDMDFQRRFRMGRNLTQRIIAELCQVQPLFNYQYDARHIRGFSPEQKVTAALRILCYGLPADATDDYIRMGKTTAFRYLRLFCTTIVDHFGPIFLRKPTQEDVERITAENAERGFPGMLGSIDCMHWTWHACPVEWAGQYKGHYPKPTVILEASASYDCWFWHAFFGLPGSNNDLNVLYKSNIFEDLKKGFAPQCNFTINGNHYTQGYYLADGIYPEWSTMVQAYKQVGHGPTTSKDMQYFNTQQMACRKDVERAFGILKRKFAIIAGPARFFDIHDMNKIMLTCIILHNMVIEETRRDPTWTSFQEEDLNRNLVIERGYPAREYRLATDRLHSRGIYAQLRYDLTKHLWALKGAGDDAGGRGRGRGGRGRGRGRGR